MQQVGRLVGSGYQMISVKLLLQLSWRNLWRHRRRNGILLAAICFSVGGVIMMNALMRGMVADMAEQAINTLNGHIKVVAPGYRDDPNIEKSFELAEPWQPDLSSEMVVGWASRIRIPAVVMSERETRGIQLVGIDPRDEYISFFGDVDVQGETLLDADDRRVVIGQALAEQLETSVGRRIVLMTQGVDGSNREAGYRIAGLYDAEGTIIEKTFVFTGIAPLQSMLGTNTVTEFSVRLSHDEYHPLVIERLVDGFADLEVLTWQELSPWVAMHVDFIDLVMVIWFFIIMGALAFGLVNTLATAVMERERELGMLRAVGMRQRSVIAQVVAESMLVMSLGIAIGLGIGYALCLAMADGLDLSAFAEGMEAFSMPTVWTPVIVARDIWAVVGLSMLLGLVASIYPARRAVKLSPLQALRR